MLVRGAALAAALVVTAPQAFASDEEIQVYMDEIGEVRKLSLDVHVNHALDGRKISSFPGEQISHGRTRVTPEFGYALSDSWELGAYLPLANIDRDGDLSVDGVKLRLKYIAPHGSEGWFWGANLEVGYVNDSLDENPWNGELKGIAGWRSDRWTLAANANFGFKVSGPADAPADFGIATKVSYSLDDSTAIGIENYNSFGPVERMTAFDRNDQEVFAVVDKTFGGWELNFGVGWGYGEPEDNFIVKAIVGIPIG